MTAVLGWRENLRAQWNANPRLRLGGWVILGIVLLYLLLVLSDARTALQASVADDAERLAKVKSLAGQDMWMDRAAAAAALAAQLEAELPEARTAGLAQAAMQGRLRELVQSYGNDVTAEVAAAGPVPGQDGWVRVPATITARGLGLERVKQLLQAIEGQPQLLAVESITLDNRNSVQLSLVVHGYYRLADTAEAPLGD